MEEDLKRKREAILQRLQLIAENGNGDTEGNHRQADYILSEFLGYLGYQDIVDSYNVIDKWYA